MNGLLSRYRWFFFFLFIPLWLFSRELSPHFCQAIEETASPLSKTLIEVDITQQKLFLFLHGKCVKEYVISTGKAGVGQLAGSCQTPLGLHSVVQKVGSGAPEGAIFRYKKNTGELCSKSSSQDLILTRILVLDGCQPGFNKGKNREGKNVDSYARCIYIHGTNHEDTIGHPLSEGCIRMRSQDVIELFDLIDQGTLVWIQSPASP